jgi:hypothetical protein
MVSSWHQRLRARALPAALAALALLAPRAAQACAVCISSRGDASALGFMWATLIMLPLPFLVVGGVIFFLWRRTRSAEQDVIRSTSSPS